LLCFCLLSYLWAVTGKTGEAERTTGREPDEARRERGGSTGRY
jgi:hypothetical protein